MWQYFRLFIFSAVLFCLPMQGKAQDKLFTQAFAHPLDLNPAFAGAIDGRYRVTAAYRDQWKSFIESPFTTFGIYGDVRIIPNEQKDDFFGGGFSLITDRTAIYNVNQNILSLFGSYHKALNADKGRYLSAGFSFGIAQRNINYENIYFNDQFDGLDQYNLSTSEILPANNFAVMDIGLGVTYRTRMSKYSNLSFGIAGDHLTGSSVSFYAHSIEPDPLIPDINMNRKFTTFLSMELASNQYVSLLPRLLWQVEGPHQMLAAAAVVKFDITNYDSKALHFGGGVRLNQSFDSGFKPSALYLMMAYEMEGLLIGLSHDVTLTNLKAQSPGKGAFELSISYTGFYENEDAMCPTF
jgi:type IX secretion system PorP/SprF family membrane protein